MSAIRSPKIRVIMEEIASEYGWKDYSFTFVKSLDWSNRNSRYVWEGSQCTEAFISRYTDAGVQYLQTTFLKSDVPRVYGLNAFDNTSVGNKLRELFEANGWRSWFCCPTFGYGGVLGLIAFLHGEMDIDPKIVEETTAACNHWRGQFNDWARALIDGKGILIMDEPLSAREIDCMALVAQGLTSAEIAESLPISKRTVEFHIQNAMLKLGGTSRSQTALQIFLSPISHMMMISRFK